MMGKGRGEEEERKRQCMWHRLKRPNSDMGTQILPVQTREKCAEKKEGERPGVGGIDNPMPPPQPLSALHTKKKVRFEEPEDNGAVEVDEDVLNQDD